MDNFEKEVKYFMNLVSKNVQLVKTNKLANMSKKEMVFFNFNIKLDGQELVVYNQEEDLFYDISVKKIQDFEFENLDKFYVLNVISLLTKYINNEISFKKFLSMYY